MRWRRPYLTAAGLALILATTVGVVAPESSSGVDALYTPRRLAAHIAAAAPGETADHVLPQELSRLSARAAADRITADGSAALARSRAVPDAAASDPLESGLAALLSTAGEPGGDAVVRKVFGLLPRTTTSWWTTLYPAQIGNLTGAPFRERVLANRMRVSAAVHESTRWPSPPRPWTQQERPALAELERLLAPDTHLIYFDPAANSGHGAWAEIRGDLDTADHVGVMVPGGSAFITGENHTRYRYRADTLVAASGGDLAMIVWAADAFPSGWLEEANPQWARHSAPRLRAFVNDLAARVPEQVNLTLLGHSYGGAIVGLAETGPLAADRVLHVASAGAGFSVETPADYSRPCRPRFAMMAPGDPIAYVQNIPAGSGLGHGVAVAELPGVTRLATGRLPDDPSALDDFQRTLGSQGLTGKRIGGIHAHSEVFIPDSDAWKNILAVLTGGKFHRATDTEPYDACR